MRKSTRRGYREVVEHELEIMPLMNLFVAMIPMLLISAVFLNVTVIDMKAPPDAAAAQANVKKERLALAVTIKENYFVVEGKRIEKRVIKRADDNADEQLASTLAAIVKQHPHNEDVMIISQPDVLYGDIVTVMDISREAGLPSAALLGVE